MQSKTENPRKIIWIISLIIFGLSLFCPTYCTNAKCSALGSGLGDFLFGWLGALFLGKTFFVWFANPFFIAAIFTNRKMAALSLFLSVVALCIALTFLKGGPVLLNEAGHVGYITKLQSGYWLWILSMFVMFIASLVSIFNDRKSSTS